MMKISELIERKKELGYTNAMIADKSGVPLATVQKIFSGKTKHPRWDTLIALEKVLSPYDLSMATYIVREEMSEYTPMSDRQFKKETDERWPRQGHYTLKDYYALPDEMRVELIDGVIYDMTAPRRIHQEILGELHLAFAACVKEHNRNHDTKCRVYFAPIDVRLFMDDKNMFEPDLVILCHEDDNELRIEGAPEFVLEVLSPSTRSKDCLIKLNKYMEAGVFEYWIVDPLRKRIMVYNFREDVVPETYSFDDVIPVGISDGECSIDFGEIRRELGI